MSIPGRGCHDVMIDHSGDGEDWRAMRLHRVMGYVCAYASLGGLGNPLGKVDRLHDHEGLLTVTWIEKPSEAEMKAFAQAWLSDIGDGGDEIEHTII